MSHLKLFILLGFVIMFVAGLTIGRAYPTTSKTPVATTPTHPSDTQPDESPRFPTLDKQLNLTADQKQQMEKIWKDARTKTDALSHQFREFDREREDQVMAILDADQSVKYKKIQDQRDEKTKSLRAEISETMRAAERETRKQLSPDQQKKFDEIVKHGGPRHGPPQGMMGGPRSHHHGGPDTAPQDGPATMQAR